MSKPHDHGCRRTDPARRSVLKTALGLGIGLPSLLDANAEPEAAAAPPKAGDRLVFLLGDKKGEVIKLDDLKVGAGQQMAFPMDPQTKTTRDGSRLNQVLVMRLDPAELTEEARKNAAEGVVAYSAICTHQGCDVSQWKEDSKKLLCVCHGTEYDPKDRAKVTFGPAPRRLAMLPLKVEDGLLVVAAGFTGKPGFKDM
jgi:rieske iron-sulfur protein